MQNAPTEATGEAMSAAPILVRWLGVFGHARTTRFQTRWAADRYAAELRHVGLRVVSVGGL